MSARAAARLESLGFTHVYRYTSGKADWAASGLPVEGEHASSPHVGMFVRRAAPRCHFMEHTHEVRERVRTAGWEECVVVNDAGVVLGRLDRKALGADRNSLVETVMEPGPTTTRPDTPLEVITKRMREKQLESVVVTTPDGQLLGLLCHQDIAQPRGEEKAGA